MNRVQYNTSTWWLGLTWLWIILKVIQPLLGCVPPPHSTLLSSLLLSSLFLCYSFLYLQVFFFLKQSLPPFCFSLFRDFSILHFMVSLHFPSKRRPSFVSSPSSPVFWNYGSTWVPHLPSGTNLDSRLLGTNLILFLDTIFSGEKQDQVNRGFQLLSAEFWVISLKAVCIVLWVSRRAHFMRGSWFLWVSAESWKGEGSRRGEGCLKHWNTHLQCSVAHHSCVHFWMLGMRRDVSYLFMYVLWKEKQYKSSHHRKTGVLLFCWT